jgi:RNA polymerase sigma-70 factor (ECF subfamily)
MQRFEDLSDWDLLARSQDGDPSGFGEIVRRHYRSAVAFCAQVLGDPHRAEDIVQRGFLNLFLARDRYREQAQFKTLLFRILLNLTINEIHRRTSAVSLSTLSRDGEGDPTRFLVDRRAADPATLAEERESRLLLRDAMLRLRPEHRAALWLREREHLTYQEIAEALDASLAEVKVWIHRARKRLLDLMLPYLDHGESLP